MKEAKKTCLVNNLASCGAGFLKNQAVGNFPSSVAHRGTESWCSGGKAARMIHTLSKYPLEMSGVVSLQHGGLAWQVMVP